MEGGEIVSTEDGGNKPHFVVDRRATLKIYRNLYNCRTYVSRCIAAVELADSYKQGRR